MITRNYINCLGKKTLFTFFTVPLIELPPSSESIINCKLVNIEKGLIEIELKAMNLDHNSISIDKRYFTYPVIAFENYQYFTFLFSGDYNKIPPQVKESIFNFWFPDEQSSLLWHNLTKEKHPFYWILFPEHSTAISLCLEIEDYFLRKNRSAIFKHPNLAPPITYFDDIYIDDKHIIYYITYESIAHLRINPIKYIEKECFSLITDVFQNLLNQWEIDFYQSISICNPDPYTLSNKQFYKLNSIHDRIVRYFFGLPLNLDLIKKANEIRIEMTKKAGNYNHRHFENPSFEKYGGPLDYDDKTIDDAFSGHPDAVWNID